jgi:ATP-dependent Clp protease ATP-binding subunit ClpB
MNVNNFTIKAQEAIQKAMEIATAKQNQSIEPIHLLKGMLLVDENVVPYLLGKLNVNLDRLSKGVDKLIDSFPKVVGGQQFFSSTANQALQKASELVSEFKDEFVSIELLLLGIISLNDIASRLLASSGITEGDLRKAIKQLRKGSTVKSQTAEETYNSLNKYALNINDLARKGKLDPVIGRDMEIRRVLQILSRRTKNNPILIGEGSWQNRYRRRTCPPNY